jgi:folate-binding protein YgfZ
MPQIKIMSCLNIWQPLYPLVMPLATSDYELAKTAAVVVDRSGRGKLLLVGADVAEFLQGQVSNDIEALEPGSGCYATLLTGKGKIRADMRILRGPDWFTLDCEPQALPVLEHMVRVYSIGRDVKSQADDRGVWSIIGPGARDVLDASPADQEHAFVQGELGVYVATHLGVDVIGDRPDLPEASDELAECLRIESGRPRLGYELGDDVIPQEAGLNERAVSFTKGCYVGQETVARLFYKGKPNRHLRGLRLDAEPRRGDVVHAGDREAGLISSTCTSPTYGPIALALIRREVAPGDTVEVGDERVAAQVVDLPF